MKADITTDDIIRTNEEVLKSRIKRSDKHEVLSYSKIRKIIDDCQTGDVDDIATCLLIRITKDHAFASGNRRTAIFVVRNYLLNNGEVLKERSVNDIQKMLKIIREKNIDAEIVKKWLQGDDTNDNK